MTRAAALLRQGFRRITRMRQMEHDLSDVPDIPAPPLRFRSLQSSLESAFAKVLQQTYEGTLDCPELCGARTIDEILAGHRGEGKFDPAYWWLVQEADCPA